MAELNDDLFGSNLDSKMDFLQDKKKVNADGIYRVDLEKVKDKKKGYRSVIRFLPNLTKEGKLGQSAIEKITHFVNIKAAKELSGYYDSMKNFNEKCPLTDLYYTLTNSKNAILQEKAKCLQYSKKYFSYVLVLEDEQQPELVGKIMIFQYGKIIRDKILSEKNGEISGNNVNVFSLTDGKDFVLIAKPLETGEITYPDYKHSMFKPEQTSLPLPIEGKGFKNVPVVDGRVDERAQGKIREFLLNREFDLDDFGPKRLTEEQQAKITEISNFLTGKASSVSTNTKPKSDDFSFDDEVVTSGSTSKTSVEDEDDFFDDI